MILSSYAVHPFESAGRFYSMVASRYRDEFQRDRDRVLHAKAFRRLAHKTQVFVYSAGDHYRNRLTHSLEVAQISRAVARILHVNEDLAELIALAHDLGHPPFGHAGEEILNEKMQAFGGFDHNAHAFRVVTEIEHRYPDYKGLNLTKESLEGILKHNGALLVKGQPLSDLPWAIATSPVRDWVNVYQQAGIEAQIAACCDDIAYNTHDIDDGVGAGFFALDDLRRLDFCRDILEQIDRDYPKTPLDLKKYEFTRRLMSYFIEDILAVAGENIKTYQPTTYVDVCQHAKPFVHLSQEGEKNNKELKKFMFEHMYYHPKILAMTQKAHHVISDLCDAYLQDKTTLPHPEMILSEDPVQDARTITDFIAGMTDKFALEEHKRLYG